MRSTWVFDRRVGVTRAVPCWRAARVSGNAQERHESRGMRRKALVLPIATVEVCREGGTHRSLYVWERQQCRRPRRASDP